MVELTTAVANVIGLLTVAILYYLGIRRPTDHYWTLNLAKEG